MVNCPECGSCDFYYVDTWINYHHIGDIYKDGVDLIEIVHSYEDTETTNFLMCEECGLELTISEYIKQYGNKDAQESKDNDS